MDQAAAASGDLEPQKTEVIDARGNRILGWRTATDRNMAWHRRNREQSRQNSRKQAAKFRDRARADWDRYVAVYRAKFPTSPPIGFDRWLRQGHRAQFLLHGEAAVHFDAKGVTFRVAIAQHLQESKSHADVVAKRRAQRRAGTHHVGMQRPDGAN